MLVGLTVGLVAYALLAAFTPEVHSDAVRQHLPLAREIWQTGAAREFPSLWTSHLPIQGHLLYAAAFGLGDMTAAKLVHTLVGLLGHCRDRRRRLAGSRPPAGQSGHGAAAGGDLCRGHLRHHALGAVGAGHGLYRSVPGALCRGVPAGHRLLAAGWAAELAAGGRGAGRLRAGRETDHGAGHPGGGGRPRSGRARSLAVAPAAGLPGGLRAGRAGLPALDHTELHDRRT